MSKKTVQTFLSTFFCLVMVGGYTTSASAYRWNVDYDHSKLGFIGTQNGQPFQGVFKHWNANILFDPHNLTESKINVSIDMRSAHTNNPERDTSMQQDTWLNSILYPQAHFHTLSFRQLTTNRYEAKSILTIRGISKEVTLPFDLNIQGNQAHATAKLTVLRTDFGIGQGFWSNGNIVGLKVTITLSVQAQKE